MALDPIGTFVEQLHVSRILAPDQMTVVNKELQPRIRDPRAMAKELMQRGWLTPYQINQLLVGNGRDLVLGPYRILDLLGEGAVAQVFCAWHTTKKCVVALKVVREEFLSNPEIVRQFQQEARTIAQLNHANVIRTLDVDQIGNRHFLSMEYIEGIDLAKLVSATGPLPVLQACDYIRQAALGLQHAHEKCLVHRDIKPANLFLVLPQGMTLDTIPDPRQMPRGCVVKILDWGLAEMRMPMATGHQEPANTLQREDTIGTADYLAPEQAMDASKVDIRADIYSLGCAFYFLLTGDPPFPGGSLLQKLLKHRESAPRPILELRPDVPANLAPVVHKMLAKKPEERYRTPASVTIALKQFCQA